MSIANMTRALTAMDDNIQITLSRSENGYKALFTPKVKASAAKDDDAGAAALIAAISRPFKIEADTPEALDQQLSEFLGGVGEARSEASASLAEYLESIASAANAAKQAAAKKTSTKKAATKKDTSKSESKDKAGEEGFAAKPETPTEAPATPPAPQPQTNAPSLF